MVGHGGRLGRLPEGKSEHYVETERTVRATSEYSVCTQPPRVTCVRTECCAISRNKGSVRTGRRLGSLADIIVNFGSPIKKAFVLKTDAAFGFLAACEARTGAAWAAWKTCSEAALGW